MTSAPQLTLKAIVLSIILTVILASANAYVGLFAGLTVATAIPAAVISMAVLPLFGRPNILENNIVATGASAGTSISAGAIFTLPALILLHHWTSFDYLVDVDHRRLGRLARRALLGAAAPHAHHRTEAPISRRRGRGGGAQSGRQSGRGRQISRRRRHRRRPVQAHHLGLAPLARDLHRARLRRRARHRLFRLWILAGAARRRLHRRPQCRDTDRGRRTLFLVAGHPALQRLLLRTTIRRCCTSWSASIPRMRRSPSGAHRCATSASAAC